MIAASDVSSLYCNEFLAYARARGIDTRGFEPTADAADVRRVGALEFCGAVASAVRCSGDRCLGLRFGAGVGGHALGLLGLAVASARTLAQALASLCRWHPLHSTLGTLRCARTPRGLDVEWLPHEAVPAPVAEAIVVGWAAFARYIAGAPLPGMTVELAHAGSCRQGEPERVVGCPVRFGASGYRLSVDAASLDAPSRFADAMVHGALSTWLDEAVRAFAPGHGSLLQALADDEEPSWDTVAQRLVAGRRTLQRELSARGLSFRAMRNAMRASIAVVGLCAGRESHIDIAARLGYVEQASFSRMVAQWTGRAPRDLARRFGAEFGRLRSSRATD